MRVWKCLVCGHVFRSADYAKFDIPMSIRELTCPRCGNRQLFQEIENLRR